MAAGRSPGSARASFNGDADRAWWERRYQVLMQTPGAYAQAMLDGRFPTCELMGLSAERFLRDRRDARWHWNGERAAGACLWMERNIIVPSGPKAGRELRLLLPQVFLVSQLHGWYRDDGARRFTAAYVEAGKGIGKTPVGAFLLLYWLYRVAPVHARGFVLAEGEKQSGVALSYAAAAGAASPKIRGGLAQKGVDPDVSILRHRGKKASVRVVGSRTKSGHSGPVAEFLWGEEVHEWIHGTEEILKRLELGQKHSRNPLTLMTTNAGLGLQESACGVIRTRAVEVLRGSLEAEDELALIWEVDQDDDPFADEGCWRKSLPCLDAGLPTREYVRRHVVRAVGPTKRSEVGRLLFGIWESGAADWLTSQHWEPAFQASLSPETERAEVPCYAGLDMSTVTDMSAGALVWDFGDRWEAEVRAWLPGDDIDALAEQARLPYREWAEEGHLHLTDGATVAYGVVGDWILAMQKKWDIVGWGLDDYRRMDLWRALEERKGNPTVDLADRRRDGSRVLLVSVPQRYWRRDVFDSRLKRGKRRREAPQVGISVGAREVEDGLVDKAVRLGESPPLRAATNAVIMDKDPSGNRCPNKAGTAARIDPLVALLNGVAMMAALRGQDVSGGAGVFARVAEAFQGTARDAT